VLIETKVSKSAVLQTKEAWPWRDSLDALVAAPAYHSKLLENEQVRVLHTLIPPGAIVPLHTHRCGGAAYLLSWSDFVRRDQDGKVLVDSRSDSAPPSIPCAQWTDPLPPHTVENVGGSVLSIVLVELKSTSVEG
jgi:hypothetical protein